MASYLADTYLDEGLTSLKTAISAVHFCSALPTTYAEATSTYSLGSKASPAVTGPADGAGGGRAISVSGFTGGVGTGAGTSTHFALVSADTLLVAGLWAAAKDIAVDAALSTTGPLVIRFADIVAA